MARGVVAGVICGTVVAAGAAAILSVTLGPPLGPAPKEVATSAPIEPAAPDEAGAEPAVTAGEEADTAPSASDAPDAPESGPQEPPPEEPQPSASPDVGAAPEREEAIAQVAEDAAPEIPAEAAAPSDAPAPTSNDAPEPEAAPLMDAMSAPEPETAEAPATSEAPAPEEGPAPPDAGSAPAAGGAPRPPDLPQAEDGLPSAPDAGSAERPGIGRPARSIEERNAAVAENRLPRIGDAAESDAAADDGSTGGGALRDNAMSVEVEEGAPRMAVILIDDGRGPMGPDALGAFPFPLSFAISPDHPDPHGAARAYRELGYEVLALVGVADDADAAEVDASLEEALQAVPQAVAVLEDPADGLQGSHAVSQRVTEAMGTSGHGLVMLPNGLNTAQQLAARSGVPSLTLFRDFDGDEQDQGVIRRFLDQGAFKARQDGAVAMLGRLNADTVSALVLWGLQDRPSSVAMVPVSMVLGAQGE